MNATIPSTRWRTRALLAACVLLASCSATRLAYDNADTALRFMIPSYLDLDAVQTEDMRLRIVRFHQWHRSSELPAYAALMRSASERAARGITSEDVAWGFAHLRSRYHIFAAKAAEDAAPVLATLAPEQIAALEHRFAENNQKFAKEFLAADGGKRRRAQVKRMLERFSDFAGDLTRDQEARIERFALAHESHVALRFEDRRQLQRDVIAALKQSHDAQELGASLAGMFRQPERRRTEAFIREDKAWDQDFGQLIVDLDRTLSARQRAQVVRRLSDYADDFAALAAALLAGPGAAWAAAGTIKPWSGGATPPLALRDVEGREHRLADYKGKVVVLNFWATWCDPCREEMPSMQRLQDKLAGRPFVILAVDYGEGPPRIKDFLKTVPVRFTVLLDRDTSAATAWKVKVLPTTLVIDADQKVRFVAVGDVGWDTPPVESEIMKLLPKP